MTDYYKHRYETIQIAVADDYGRGCGYWSVFENIDMTGLGDVELIQNWKSTMTIDDLKRKVEENNWSAISVGDFPFAAIKSFPYQLEPSYCKPSQGYKNTLYIYTPPAHLAKKSDISTITRRNPNLHNQRGPRNSSEIAVTNTNCCGCKNPGPPRLEKEGDVDARITLKFYIEG